MKNKEDVRKEVFVRLESQTKIERRQASNKIIEKLFCNRRYAESRILMCYVSTPLEVDTHLIIEHSFTTGKRVAVPYIEAGKENMIAAEIKNKEELEQGPYGIYQPKKRFLRRMPAEQIDLVIVPGIAFSPDGQRLGRGKGYYDRFLKTLPQRTATIGVCFNFQLYNSLPFNVNDVPVKEVIHN